MLDKNKLKPIYGFNNVIKSSSHIIAFGDVPVDGKYGSVTELKENGVIEAVDTKILKEGKVFPFPLFINKISASINQYLDILIDDLEVETPIFFSLIINDVKEYEIANQNMRRPIIQKEKLEYYNLIENKRENRRFIKQFI